MLDSLDDPDPELPEPEEPVALGVELEELGVELEEPVAPELGEPLALCSLWHFSSASPVRPVQSVLEPVVPVEAGSDAVPVDGEVPLTDGALPGVALSDDDPPLDMPPLELLPLEVPLALELSVPDDPLELCAHDAVAKPSRAAVIAALITFNFMDGIPLGLGLPRP